MPGNSIRIISVPPGDAPPWVREKWVGLTLPIVGSDSRRVSTVSVNEKATVWNHLKAVIAGRSKVTTGYQVKSDQAVDILAASSPEAAGWWRQNAPDLLRAGRHFIFYAEACQIAENKKDE